MTKIPTQDPQTRELNLLSPEEEVVKIIPTFDMKQLVGKNFRYKGQYGLSTWTDKVKAIRSHNSIQFETPFKIVPQNEDGSLTPLDYKIVGMKYKFFVVSERSEQNYEFEDCIFLID